MIPMALPMADDTDVAPVLALAQSHIIPLNNHLNKRNPIVPLMAPSAFCDRKHGIQVYAQN